LKFKSPTNQTVFAK